jgi:IclR family transcriptional regulator, KDG regulon repressor
MKKNNGESFYNRSLERALLILDVFTVEKQSLSLAQLSEELNLSRATVLRLCSTLAKYNFLKHDTLSKRYSLGVKLFELGSIVYNSFSLRKVASSHLIQLQAKLSTTVFLGIIDNDELLYIDKIDDPKHPITFTSKIGTRRTPYWGMVGTTIMAYLPVDEVERLLQKFPLKRTAKKSIIKKEDFLEYLHRIRIQGFAFDDEGTMDGVGGVAAPVYDLIGKIVGAVGVAFISSSADAKAIKKMIKEAVLTARNISAEMGYFGKDSQSS